MLASNKTSLSILQKNKKHRHVCLYLQKIKVIYIMSIFKSSNKFLIYAKKLRSFCLRIAESKL